MKKGHRCVRWFLLASAIATLATSDGPAQTVRDTSPADQLLTRLGYAESARHRNLVVAACELANNVLSIDTSYQLSVTHSPSNAIPVYLVSGANLGPQDYSFVPGGERCVVVNADLIPKLVRSFGFAYDDSNELQDPHPAHGHFSRREDNARKACAIILMHEIGHVWVHDHGRYKGTPSPTYDGIAARVEPNKLEELEADKFCADRLAAANKLLNKALDEPDFWKKVAKVPRAEAGQLAKQLRAATD